MDNQNNNKIIQFGNNLNPNSNNNNNKRFNDLTNNNQIQNNNHINNIRSNINNQVNSQPNMNIQSNNIQNSNNIQPQNSINQNLMNAQNNNNQEVVNIEDNSQFKAKVEEGRLDEKQNIKKAISTIVIIIIVLLILFGIIVLANKFLFNSKVDNNNSLIFVSNAESFITDAKSLVKKDTLSSKDLNFAPSCKDETKKETIIYLSKILSNVNDNKISPFGGEYNLDKSYVKVKAKDKNNTCTYEYYLYLTDNNYSIGTENNPINSDNITKEVVKKNSK